VTNDDLALRSSIGLLVFTPPGVNERFIETAGFNLLRHAILVRAAGADRCEQCVASCLEFRA
jgi:alkylhydroperoxidase family enzyme